MDFLHQALSVMMHIDKHLYDITSAYGVWVYLLLFIIIFSETGLVVVPFLPGDSLLFAAGAIAALGSLNAHLLFVLLAAAAFLGTQVNYTIGFKTGVAFFVRKGHWLFNPEYIEMTQRYFDRYGKKTIVIARFMPIVRTFAPFVAGIGMMERGVFLKYNVFGALLWVFLFIYGGYLFGNIPMVKRNFSAVILVIIVISIMPAVLEFLRHRYLAKSPGK